MWFGLLHQLEIYVSVPLREYGSYFIAILIEWFGADEDQPLAQIAYWIAFPAVVLCGLALVVDLHRPERFWHMLLKSEVTKAALAGGFPFTGAGWQRAVQAPCRPQPTMPTLRASERANAWAATAATGSPTATHGALLRQATERRVSS